MQKKRYRRRAKYGILKRLKAPQKIKSFAGWFLAFVEPFPNMIQNKPHKKLINGELVQMGFQPESFRFVNLKKEKVGKERDHEEILSEYDEYLYTYEQLLKKYPYGFDVYSKN